MDKTYDLTDVLAERGGHYIGRVYAPDILTAFKRAKSQYIGSQEAGDKTRYQVKEVIE